MVHEGFAPVAIRAFRVPVFLDANAEPGSLKAFPIILFDHFAGCRPVASGVVRDGQTAGQHSGKTGNRAQVFHGEPPRNRE